MKKSGITALCLVLISCFTVTAAACGENGGQPDADSHVCADICATCGGCLTDCTEPGCAAKCDCEPVSVEHTQTMLLKGTIWETAVHKYVTDKAGPKIAIVGGIHGDETAGWTAGLELVDKLNGNTKGICGQILLIPQANIIADNRTERYAGSKNSKNGIGTVNGVTYSDLNRSFPDGRASNAQQATVTISEAVRLEVEAFNPDYVIDLHESQHSYTNQSVTTNLGDTLIYKNRAMFMDDLIYYYNKAYRQSGETEFTSTPDCKQGSFNLYFTNLYPEKAVFTIETNRGYVAGQGDTVQLAKRVRQQTNILEALFDLVWERKDVSDIL